MTGMVLAVDGGNSKTELAIAHADGTVLALTRGPASNPHLTGVDGAIAVMRPLYEQAMMMAGLSTPPGHAVYALAGADLPPEEVRLEAALGACGWSERCRVRNDTIAVLRSGSERGWGVAVVCGAGINARGVAPDGREERFLSLGATSGDWGGGGDLGLGALGAATRAEDGRGPQTRLRHDVPAHFGLRAPTEVALAVFREEIPAGRLVELAPLVLAAATEGDGAAAALVDRLAAEVVDFIRAAIDRLAVDGQEIDVVLGGGLMHAANARLDRAVDDGVAAITPRAHVRRPAVPPVAGAVLLALDEMGATPGAEVALRGHFADDAWRTPQPVAPLAVPGV